MATEDILSVKLENLHGDVVEVKKVLNELSRAITKLALMEQQQSHTMQAVERAFKQISKIDDRVGVLEQAAPKGKETSEWMDRLILALLVLVFSILGQKIGISL